MAYAYSVYGVYNGKPAGYVATFATREAADRRAQMEGITCQVKREQHPDRYVALLREGHPHPWRQYLSEERPEELAQLQRAEGKTV